MDPTTGVAAKASYRQTISLWQIVTVVIYIKLFLKIIELYALRS